MNDVGLLEAIHPDRAAQAVFDSLVGIDEQKALLLAELVGLLAPERLEQWLKRHHPKGVALADRWKRSLPLILLSGEVGCGKTALAGAIASPLGKEIDRRVVTVETPSDLRGWGHVGEVSARITEAFTRARRRAKEVGAGILVIDEADDIATARAQMQAHHEDRAGLNVLIKQIDQLARSRDPLAVILVTNRDGVLDPAVRRRSALHLQFARPNAAARAAVFARLLEGVPCRPVQIEGLVGASDRPTPYSYSDLVDRLARGVLREAQRRNVPISPELMLECLAGLEPTPLIEAAK